MANPEHFNLVCQGKDAINEWRKDAERSVALDLRGAELSNADLHDADLSAANLRSANLFGADLRDADLHFADLRKTDLRRANLRRTNLRRASLSVAKLGDANLSDANLRDTDLRDANLDAADLSRANLREANLRGANLSGANLSGASLSLANFSGANLHGANFTNANVFLTLFSRTDLSKTQGLGSVVHRGPSTLGLDTLHASRGKIPEAFLRGCGVPENHIAYLPSLTGNALEFYSCFISYSHADMSFARRLHDALQGRGIRVWLDEHQLLPGDDIYESVDKGIRLWDKVLLCTSQDSLSSWWVDREIDTAMDKEKQLFQERGENVLAIVPCDLDGFLYEWKGAHAAALRKRLAADFTGWETDNAKFERGFERIVQALQTGAGARPPAPDPKL